MSLEETLRGAKSWHGLQGVTTFYVPWDAWYRLALELGPRSQTARIGLLCDYRGDVYIACSGITATMHNHASPRAFQVDLGEHT